MRVLFLFLIAIVFFQLPSFAQDDYYGPYRYKTGSTAYVFSDVAYLRSAAGTGAPVVDSLPAAAVLTIIGPSQVMESGHKRAPWYRVSYTAADGAKRAAYLWGGLLAISATSAGDGLFLMGIEGKFHPDAADESEMRLTEKEGVTVHRKGVRDKVLISLRMIRLRRK